ncbi:MAG TPA: hypothetical protein VH878_02250, partial [Thermodesulfobacteriota bacterium]
MVDNNLNMKNPLYWIEEELDLIRDKNLFRVLTELQSGQSPEIIIDGKGYILLASNNYLGLTNDPKVKESAQRA